MAAHVLLHDMNVNVADSRRIEVFANGLSLRQNAQTAVDTTFVSPVSRDGSALAGADRVPGKTATDAGRHRHLHGAACGPTPPVGG